MPSVTLTFAVRSERIEQVLIRPSANWIALEKSRKIKVQVTRCSAQRKLSHHRQKCLMILEFTSSFSLRRQQRSLLICLHRLPANMSITAEKRCSNRQQHSKAHNEITKSGSCKLALLRKITRALDIICHVA